MSEARVLGWCGGQEQVQEITSDRKLSATEHHRVHGFSLAFLLTNPAWSDHLPVAKTQSSRPPSSAGGLKEDGRK